VPKLSLLANANQLPVVFIRNPADLWN